MIFLRCSFIYHSVNRRTFAFGFISSFEPIKCFKSIKVNVLTLHKFWLSFLINLTHYSQPNGLAMGFTIFRHSANLLMDHFVNNFILNKFNNIMHYLRYVDDCLVFIESDINDANDVLIYNPIHSWNWFSSKNQLCSSNHFQD